MPKMKVDCKMLYFKTTADADTAGRMYPQGSIIDVTAEEARDLVHDGLASAAPAGAEVSKGTAIAIDPVEQAIREKKFEEVRKAGAMTAPEGAEKVSDAKAGHGAALEGMTRMPAGAHVEPIPGSKGR